MDKSNVEYVSVINTLENALSQIKSKEKELFNKGLYKTFEDSRSNRELENIIEKLEDTIRELEYYRKDVVTGYLYKNSDGRYALNGDKYFTCGSGIELFNLEEQEWKVGHIEHNSKDYYFFSEDGREYHDLQLDGKRARYRKG